jgi:hypothetical protein
MSGTLRLRTLADCGNACTRMSEPHGYSQLPRGGSISWFRSIPCAAARVICSIDSLPIYLIPWRTLSRGIQGQILSTASRAQQSDILSCGCVIGRYCSRGRSRRSGAAGLSLESHFVAF